MSDRLGKMLAEQERLLKATRAMLDQLARNQEMIARQVKRMQADLIPYMASKRTRCGRELRRSWIKPIGRRRIDRMGHDDPQIGVWPTWGIRGWVDHTQAHYFNLTHGNTRVLEVARD